MRGVDVKSENCRQKQKYAVCKKFILSETARKLFYTILFSFNRSKKQSCKSLRKATGHIKTDLLSFLNFLLFLFVFLMKSNCDFSLARILLLDYRGLTGATYELLVTVHSSQHTVYKHCDDGWRLGDTTKNSLAKTQ